MITWNMYFVLVRFFNRVVDETMPSKHAAMIAEYVDKFDAVRMPLLDWQKDVLFKADETNRDILWVEKMDETVEIPKFKFSEISVHVTPAEVKLLKECGLW